MISTYRWHDLTYSIDNSKEPPTHTKLLKLMSSARFQNIKSIYKNLHNDNWQPKNKTEKTIQFIIIPKRIKYLGIKLTKELQDLYTINYKTLLKEITEDRNKWKDIPCLCTGKLVRWQYSQKQFIDSMHFLYKPQRPFCRY